MVIRLIKNVMWSKEKVLQLFPEEDLARIEAAVRAAEVGHRAEIKVCVEGAMPFWDLLRRRSTRKRAAAIFKKEKIGITAERTGILLYVLMAEQRVEILADHGVIVSSNTLEEWAVLFSAHAASSSVLDAIIKVVEAIGAYARQNFTQSNVKVDLNEISDKPKLL